MGKRGTDWRESYKAMEKEKKVKEIKGEEKQINILKFEEFMENTESASMGQYFSQQNLDVTRGELFQILQQVMGNIDNELADSFKRVVMTHNLVDVVVQALVQKNLLNDEDLRKAQEILVDELSNITDKEV